MRKRAGRVGFFPPGRSLPLVFTGMGCSAGPQGQRSGRRRERVWLRRVMGSERLPCPKVGDGYPTSRSEKEERPGPKRSKLDWLRRCDLGRANTFCAHGSDGVRWRHQTGLDVGAVSGRVTQLARVFSNCVALSGLWFVGCV